MKQEKNILPFEHLLDAFFINGDSLFNSKISDIETEIVFSAPIELTLSDERKKNLFASLSKLMSHDTLGTLVSSALEKQPIGQEEIHLKTGLTPSVLDTIKNDMAFTNSIPVKSLVKLLKMLEIPVEKVKVAVQQTFDKLNTESKIFFSIPANAQPSFRKGAKRNDLVNNLTYIKNDESYLYQNKEALDKYVKRLTELYHEL